MRSSLKLFTLFGIPVHLHWTFGLILLYPLWLGYSNSLPVMGTVWLLGFFIALFACVLLHEYGHSLTARKYGVETQDIILTPIGGIARLERMPEKPVQEFLVAIAGPLVNVGIAILLFALGTLLYSGDSWEVFSYILREQFNFGESAGGELDESNIQISGLLFYLPVLIATNIALFVFNLIPAFPMDGGRIFRALLAMQIGRVRATRAASLVGQGMAVLFVILGLWQGQFTLTLIGVFVFTTARAENSMVQLDDVLRNHSAREMLRTQFTRVNSMDWMQSALEQLQQGTERGFMVFDINENPVGVLREQEILTAMKNKDLTSPVEHYMHTEIPAIGPDDSLYMVYVLLRQERKGLIAVVENGLLLGVIDELGLDTFLRIHQIK
ncbi:MAG: site-2 protease family protein [Saprospiraceae bacterium]